MSTNTKLAEPVNAVAVLRNVLNTLKHENSKPDGSISDTIWYSAYETLFDYVESSLEAIAAHDAEQAQEPISYLVRARWPDRIEEYLEVRGVTVLGVGKVGIDVDIPKLHPFGAAPVEQAQPMFPKCASGTSEQAAQAVPAGFKWVPVEPTLEMLTAAGREDDKAFVDGMPHGATADDVWAVMLSAAPAAPAPEAQQPAGQELPPLPPIDDYLPTDGPRWTTANFIACVERYATDYARAALAQRRQPLTDEDWRTRDSSDTDEGCAALHRAHGIGATTGKEPGNA